MRALSDDELEAEAVATLFASALPLSPAFSSSSGMLENQETLEGDGDEERLSLIECAQFLEDEDALDWTLGGDSATVEQTGRNEGTPRRSSAAPARSPTSSALRQRDARRRELAASSSSRYRHRKKVRKLLFVLTDGRTSNAVVIPLSMHMRSWR